jgi:RNA polymerase sigma-70 factor (ECF subfamily)
VTLDKGSFASLESPVLYAIRGGDGDAFADLYQRYSGFAYGIASAMLADSGAAEDTVQSVFFSIWMSPPELLTGTFARWLAFVTRNRARDVLRARINRRESGWAEHLVAADSPADLVCRQFEDVRVRAALTALPETQRSLIELGFYGEHSHAELAELTRLPLGTVKTRIRAGLQKLRFTLA